MKSKLIIELLLAPVLVLSANESSLSSSESSTTETVCTDVVTDLEKLGLYKSENISSTENKFITFSQAYSSKDELKSYVYLNFIGDAEYKLNLMMSTAINSNECKSYTLDCVSYDKDTNLKKYEVLDLDNLDSTTRRYYLNNVQNEENEKMFDDDLNKSFYFNGTNNGNLECYTQEIETISITDKQVAMFCYGDSMNFFGKETGSMQSGNVYNDSWFIFFNTDKQIDNLLEVELVYTQYDFTIGAYGSINGVSTLDMSCVYTESFVSDFVANPPIAYSGGAYSGDFYLNYQDAKTITIKPGTKKVESTQYGWFGTYKTTYETLDNIMDLRKYQAQDKDTFVFTDYANSYTWGVHFNDTTRTFTQKGSNGVAGLIKASGVTDAAILKLTFETDNKVKTLAAIDKPSSSDDNQGNTADTPTWDDLDFSSIIDKLFGNELKKTVKIVLGVVIGVFGLYLISLIIKFIKGIFKNFKGK